MRFYPFGLRFQQKQLYKFKNLIYNKISIIHTHCFQNAKIILLIKKKNIKKNGT